MPTDIHNIDNLIESISSVLISEHLLAIHDGPLLDHMSLIRHREGRMEPYQIPWEPYAKFALQIHSSLTGRLIQDNPFVRQKTAAAFSYKILELCEIAVGITLRNNPDLLRQLEDASDAFIEQEPEALSDQSTRDEHEQYVKVSQARNTELQQRQQDIIRRLTVRCNNLIQVELTAFLERFNQCESPLESAFLIGAAAHNLTVDMFLPTTGTFDCQLNVGSYRLDFALQIPENKLKLDIELDGHTYHERTEDQAVADRRRDRDLMQQGWKVIRFHRRELEADLEHCIEQVVAAQSTSSYES